MKFVSPFYPILDLEFCISQNLEIDSILESWVYQYKKYFEFIQIRSKKNKEFAKEIYLKCKKKFPNLKIIFNDYIELALELNSDGLHLGKEDFLKLERKDQNYIRTKFSILGTSSHNLNELQNLNENYWNYTGLGPIFETNNKISINPTLGITHLKEYRKATKTPIYLIGGVQSENYREILKSSFFPIAGISCFCNLSEFEKLIEIYNTHSVDLTN